MYVLNLGLRRRPVMNRRTSSLALPLCVVVVFLVLKQLCFKLHTHTQKNTRVVREMRRKIASREGRALLCGQHFNQSQYRGWEKEVEGGEWLAREGGGVGDIGGTSKVHVE